MVHRHVQRMREDILPKQVMTRYPTEIKERKSRPNTYYSDGFKSWNDGINECWGRGLESQRKLATENNWTN